MEEFFGIAPLILIFPVIGVLFNGLVGRRFVDYDRNMGEKWSGWFASIMALSAFVVVVLLDLALQASHHEPATVNLWNWIVIPSLDFFVPWAMQIDTLSVTMMLVVTGVGSIIHIYSIGYMHGDPDYSRYFTYLNLFLFFMLILVSGNNYLVLFVGWEGVGLCSYLLIGFWHERLARDGTMKNADAARKAMIANRVGDAAMILGIILTFWAFGSVMFEEVFHHATELVLEGDTAVQIFGAEVALSTILTSITVLFLIAATGKSAQLVLHVWLPDAMAGPTPASALIHAATMVTSGIYLIVRSNVLYELARLLSPTGFTSSDLVALVGASTALYAGLIAFTQNDIKKVLAYSTVSQLGFMIAAAGMGAYVAAIFHLITHAFFKALLFMGAGSVIHGMEHGHHVIAHGEHDHEEDDFDPQDMRFMGGLRHKMPATFWTYLVGALALAGIAPFAGFWSKDEILAHAIASGNREISSVMFIVYVLLVAAAFCTAFYMGRQISMVFLRKPRHEAANHAHESPKIMTIPLGILAALAVIGGLVNSPRLNGSDVVPYTLALEHWLEESLLVFELEEELEPALGEDIHVPHTPTSISFPIAGSSFAVALIGLLSAVFVIYRKSPESARDKDPTQKIPGLWGIFGRLPLDSLYMKLVVPGFNRFAWWLSQKFEWRFWHDFIHDNIIRDTFLWFADLIDILDKQGVDGLVNGLGNATRWLADGIRVSQTGHARTYALSVFLGAVALLLYFLWPYIMN